MSQSISQSVTFLSDRMLVPLHTGCFPPSLAHRMFVHLHTGLISLYALDVCVQHRHVGHGGHGGNCGHGGGQKYPPPPFLKFEKEAAYCVIIWEASPACAQKLQRAEIQVI